MDLESVTEGNRPVPGGPGAAGSAAEWLDPVALGLGPAESDGAKLLVEAYGPRFKRFFLSKGFSSEAARDLTQDTFFRVFRTRAVELKSRDDLTRWLLTIASNVAKNDLRAQQAGKRFAFEISLDAPREGEDGEGTPKELEDRSARNPRDEILWDEKLRRLEREIAEMPEKMRQVIRLRALQGRSQQEVAIALGISEQTVKSHLHQARQRLRERLGDDFGAIDV